MKTLLALVGFAAVGIAALGLSGCTMDWQSTGSVTIHRQSPAYCPQEPACYPPPCDQTTVYCPPPICQPPVVYCPPPVRTAYYCAPRCETPVVVAPSCQPSVSVRVPSPVAVAKDIHNLHARVARKIFGK